MLRPADRCGVLVDPQNVPRGPSAADRGSRRQAIGEGSRQGNRGLCVVADGSRGQGAHPVAPRGVPANLVAADPFLQELCQHRMTWIHGIPDASTQSLA
jgi:hypothetical protein